MKQPPPLAALALAFVSCGAYILVWTTSDRASPRSTMQLSPVHARLCHEQPSERTTTHRGNPRSAAARAERAATPHQPGGGVPQRSRNSRTSSGLSGPSVRDQVNQLVRKGYVNRESRKARGLTVLREPPDEVLALLAVPVVGSVAAVAPGPLLEVLRLDDQRVVVTADAARSGPVQRVERDAAADNRSAGPIGPEERFMKGRSMPRLVSVGESAATSGVLACL